MEIGWGSTRIPALPNNIVAVLNTEQAGAMITEMCSARVVGGAIERPYGDEENLILRCSWR